MSKNLFEARDIFEHKQCDGSITIEQTEEGEVIVTLDDYGHVPVSLSVNRAVLWKLLYRLRDERSKTVAAEIAYNRDHDPLKKKQIAIATNSPTST